MSSFKLLIADDNSDDRQICKDSIETYTHKFNREIELIECSSVKEAFEILDKSFDGAIIDLKLSTEGDEGNQIIQRINDFHLRIPIALVTATPDSADYKFDYIGKYKKGAFEYHTLLDDFWKIHCTGLAKIMGGRGVIEKELDCIFNKCLLPSRVHWEQYGAIDPDQTERALLRHTVAHLSQLLHDSDSTIFPEEAYLHPPLTEELRSGSIVKNTKTDVYHAVVTPACDLVVRKNGSFKTDHILIIEIVEDASVIQAEVDKIDESKKNTNSDRKKKIKGMLKTLFSNNLTPYFHALPKTDFFNGGLLNFRKTNSVPKEQFEIDFCKTELQITPDIIKDILSRFSSYCARQGQPDIDYDSRITQISTEHMQPTEN